MIDDLKEIIKEKRKPLHDNLPSSRLKLWGVNTGQIPSEEMLNYYIFFIFV
jgi:hypothetical protein